MHARHGREHENPLNNLIIGPSDGQRKGVGCKEREREKKRRIMASAYAMKFEICAYLIFPFFPACPNGFRTCLDSPHNLIS